MKKDIFNGKIKKEFYSYILTYMIFFTVLLVGMGALCVYAFVWGMAANSFGERLLIAAFGGIAFALAGVYLFLELLVIHKFPKYEKIRRILFNSDCYFTDSTSNEYVGEVRTVSGRRNKAAFDMVTAIASVEKKTGDKKSIRYKIYNALAIVMALLGILSLVAMPLLYENGMLFSNISDSAFVFLLMFVGFVCITLAILFLLRALK